MISGISRENKKEKRFGKRLAILILANMIFAAVFYLTQIYETKNMIENERILRCCL